MSNVMSTLTMASELIKRLPIGIDTNFARDRLNEAYRFVQQKGNFTWDVRKTTVNVAVGATTFTIPADADPGKPMVLSGPIASPNLGVIIPYKPWDEVFSQQFFNLTAGAGSYSAWSFYTAFLDPASGSGTFVNASASVTGGSGLFQASWAGRLAVVSDGVTSYTVTILSVAVGGNSMTLNAVYAGTSASHTFTLTPSYAYTGIIYPASATPTGVGGFNLPFIYHADTVSPLTIAANQFFPTPASFDTMLIELAEAETRRIYGLAGWDVVQKRAELAITGMLDNYRSTKNTLAGLTDQMKQTQEKQLTRQE